MPTPIGTKLVTDLHWNVSFHLFRLDSVNRQLIDVRRVDLFSTITTDIRIPEVVGQDENDVRLRWRLGMDGDFVQ